MRFGMLALISVVQGVTLRPKFGPRCFLRNQEMVIQGQLNRLLAKVHFNPKPNVITERFNFHRSKQEYDETIPEFITALKRLSQNYEFSDIEREMID
ncbi:K02A2.6-like [Cordylochernes scorpioides]|uniref:K02A2.6-like n=1 Tax=Cordylochernes scorpioides TaxID=51811 RepID=A0ABY6LVJ0_9ARAC|nr:K02A2.6-like [Cordylochernes scorpioides]